MLTKRANFFLAMKVLLGATSAVLVLMSWLFHPAMSGEMREAGRWLVWALMIGVGVIAVIALILGWNSKSKPGNSRS